MIGLGYEDQAAAVVAEVGTLARSYGAPEHNGTCAFFVILSMEENAALDGVELTDAQAVDLAVRAITEDGRCYCDEA